MKLLKLALPFRTSGNPILRNFTNQRAGKALITVPKIEIADGQILYLLMSIYIHGETLYSRTIVRGQPAKNHVRVYDRVRSEMESLGLCVKPLGGGMMDVDNSARTMKIYGKCKTFGRANHYKTMEIMKESENYKNYNITMDR
ncbi:sex-regulated protein janus-B-like [Drosophila novamexicana]|uniref:sex-regulated protein janus-B-like n=1 Tax=Drosophila novamexicana TaxID=47314 RepID=UPI0011E5CAB7|nr:sex-regulated protein janus-B-like [Drosophila novamexicana]